MHFLFSIPFLFSLNVLKCSFRCYCSFIDLDFIDLSSFMLICNISVHLHVIFLSVVLEWYFVKLTFALKLRENYIYTFFLHLRLIQLFVILNHWNV